MNNHTPHTYRPLPRVVAIVSACFFLLVAGIQPVLSQGVTLDKFDVFQHENQVFLSWVIARGGTCNGILIERSTDNITFEEIGYIPGVCGSASAPQPYSHIDENPVANQTNYYRLELGLQGFSETRSIDFQLLTEGLNVVPNPAHNHVKIRFSNHSRQEATLEVFNLSGKLVRELKSSDMEIQVDVSNLESSIYLLRLLHPGMQKPRTARLVVNRP